MQKKLNIIFSIVSVVILLLTSFLVIIKYNFDHEKFEMQEGEYSTIRIEMTNIRASQHNSRIAVRAENRRDDYFDEIYNVIDNSVSDVYFKVNKNIETRVTIFLFNYNLFSGHNNWDKLNGGNEGTNYFLNLFEIESDGEYEKTVKVQKNMYDAVFERGAQQSTYALQITFTPSTEKLLISMTPRVYIDDYYAQRLYEGRINFYEELKI